VTGKGLGVGTLRLASQQQQESCLLPTESKPSLTPPTNPIFIQYREKVIGMWSPHHTSSTRAEAQNNWSHISTPPYVFIACTVLN